MKKILKSLSLVFALALTFAFSLQASAQTLVRQMEGVTEYRLANGLQVLLAPNDLQPRVYANLIIKAGSAVEGTGEGGMAHLLEHLLFKGTPSTKDPMREFSERAFNANGTTDIDRTNYFASMNANKDNLHWYIGWLADAMNNSFIAKADLDKEMPVVRNEFERGAGSIGRGMAEARMALTFPNHGYGRPVIGNRSDIENVNIERLQAFYKTWYRPDNAVLVVTGRFVVQETLAHIQKVFGALVNPNTPLPRLYTREPIQDGLRSTIIRRVGGEPQLLLSWRGAANAHPDDATLDVVASALAGSESTPFAKAIDEKKLGTQPRADHTAYAQYGFFSVGLQMADSGQASAIKALLEAHIARIANEGVTEEELARAKTIVARNKQEVKNSAEGFGATLANSAAAGDWRLSFWHGDNMAKVTIADTRRAASQYLVPANLVVVEYQPEAAPKRAPDVLPQLLGDYITKTTASAAAELERFDASAAELDKRTVKSVLPVGTKVALLARPAVGDAIQGTLRLHYGNLAAYQHWNRTQCVNAGLAANFAALLTKGTAKLSQKQLVDTLNNLQSNFTVSSSLGGLTVNFKTTRAHWQAFADLLTEVLREPAFMQANFDSQLFSQWKTQNLGAIQASRDQPNTLAENAISRTLWRFEANDPRYTRTSDESLAAWQALGLEDMRVFWRQFVGASVSEFAAAGALDVASVQISVAKLMEGWTTPSASGVYARIPYALPTWTPAVQTIATPDKASASLLARRTLPMQAFSKEALAAQMANGIIGGSSASRLFTKLRKEEGLTYGANSWLAVDDDFGFASFNIGGTFAPQNRSRFEQVLAEIKQDITNNGLWRLELSAAKRVALERTKANRENDSSVAGTLAYNEHRGRSYAFWQAQSDLAQSLTIEDIDAAAKKLLAAQDFVTVITGDFK
jgi:zinc protease